MTEYNELVGTPVEANKRVRSYECILKNPLGGMPHAIFNQESVLETAEGIIASKVVEPLMAYMSDPQTTITILDENLQETENSFTLEELQAMMISLYVHYVKNSEEQL
jgi:hypothetical protein